MSQQEKIRKNWVTKEMFIFLVPTVAATLSTLIYDAGFCSAYGIPEGLITIQVPRIFTTTNLTIMVAAIAFLWIGLYYKILPSASSPVFQGIITIILILALSLAFQFGKADAHNRIYYHTYGSDPEMAVLAIYNNTIVSAPFDRATHILKKELRIEKIKSNRSELLKYEPIGPLNLK